MSRAFVVVLDACGVGALPDAESYGDSGSNTLGHLSRAAGGLSLPALEALGLGSIISLQGVAPAATPVLHGRLHALGPGKDSTAGHWELMGVVSPQPMPTYPDGFPEAVVSLVRAAAGREVVCNRPYNGLEAIADFGTEHLGSGALIVYTSQDSVLQIAAHEEIISVQELYEICHQVRQGLPAEHAVGRVIARPFRGTPGGFQRSEGRRDYSLPPPTRSYLEELQDAGVPVHTVGKVGQLFDGIGIDTQHPGSTNSRALAETTALLAELARGLVFTNLVDTDQVYGHRHDVAGFHQALAQIDGEVGKWQTLLQPEDLLILTADHGCDPTWSHTDHTREYVPLLALFGERRTGRHDGPMADVGASVLRWLTGRQAALPGHAFVDPVPG